MPSCPVPGLVAVNRLKMIFVPSGDQLGSCAREKLGVSTGIFGYVTIDQVGGVTERASASFCGGFSTARMTKCRSQRDLVSPTP
jgi:hypothetical protein